MQWKFWRRWRKDRNREVAAQAQDGSAYSSLLSQSSPQEILGLQKLIGNQAVLRIVAPEKAEK
jgi:hypothetical protein